MLTMLLALVMIMSVLPFTAMAEKAACDHKGYGYYLETEESTCKVQGALHFICKNCGTICQTQIKPLSGHTYGKDGKCTVCGYACTKHTYGAKVTVAPTCTETGSETKTCTKCGYKDVKTLKAAGHKFADPVAAVAATCTVEGYTAHKICSECNEKSSDYSVVAAKGHVYKTTKDVAATCTKNGAFEQVCEKCGHENKQTRKKLGHDYVDMAAQAPTCTEVGYTAYEKCNNCGKEVGKTSVAATGHTYVNGQCACGTAAPDYAGPTKPSKNCKHTSQSTYTTSSDCTVVGYTVVTCDDCHVEMSREIIAAKGHTPKTYIKDPTCTQDGFVKEVCETCGTQTSYAAQPALGHSYVNGICTICGGADRTKYTHDLQDVFLTEEG